LPVSEMVLQDAEKRVGPIVLKVFLTETLSIPPLQKSQKTIAKISHYLDMVPGVSQKFISG